MQTTNRTLAHCRALIDELGTFGVLAKQSLPLLREIAISPLSKWNIQAYHGRANSQLLETCVTNAIKQIEGAKLKSPPEPFPEDDVISDIILSRKKPGLKLNVQLNRVPVVGERYIYKIVVTNQGDIAANNVDVEYPLPDHSKLLGTSPAAEIVDNRLVWRIHPIAPHESERVLVSSIAVKKGEFKFAGKVSSKDFADAMDESHTSSVSIQEAGSEVPTQETPGQNGDAPSYNGITLAEALRLMKSDRGPEKVAILVVALNHLMDQGDPRELVRATLQMMRFQGTEVFDPNSIVITHGSAILLKQLPSKIVVEELIAELPAAITRKPTRHFFTYFLQSLEPITNRDSIANAPKSGHTDIYLMEGKRQTLAIAVDQDQLLASVEQLRREIRLKSRRLIGALVEISKQNESLSIWAVRSAIAIAHISDQQITTYPDLVPLVERVLTLPDVPDQIYRFDHRLEAAKLLGESRLHLQEGIEIAELRIKTSESIGMTSYSNGINCLVAIAANSPEAVKHLNEMLRANWEARSAFFAKAAAYRKQIENPTFAKTFAPGLDDADVPRLTAACSGLIRKIGEVGLPAKDSIPLLREIAEWKDDTPRPAGGEGYLPALNDGVTPTALSELAAKAIKQIEDAKPKPPPQPLPEDDVK